MQESHGTLIKWFYQKWMWVSQAMCMWWEVREGGGKKDSKQGENAAQRNNHAWCIWRTESTGFKIKVGNKNLGRLVGSEHMMLYEE